MRWFWSKRRLSTLTQDADNQFAIESPDRFRERFGFEVNSEIARREITRLQHDHRLTDAEVSIAKRTGALKIKGDFVEAKYSRFMIIIGWVQLTPIAIVGLAALVTLLWKAPMKPQPIAMLGGTFLVASGAVYLMYIFYIRANRLFSRSRRDRVVR